MATIDPTTALGDLVTANPALAARLDRLNLDYCCGGQTPLADAVDAAGLDLAQVLDELGRVIPGSAAADWAGLDPAALADHIESTHHAYLHEALPRLGKLVDKVAAVHGARHPELVEIRSLFGRLRAELEPHLRDEEQLLFPMIRELDATAAVPSIDGGTLADLTPMLLAEHDITGEQLARLRALTDTYTVPDDGCASYRALYAGLAELEADTHLHVHKENHLLFPRVAAADARRRGGAA